MLFLKIPLLAVLLATDDNEDATAFQEEISFKMIHTSSFYNYSWVKIQNSAWLDDLQTHGWDTNSGRIIFLRPWSKGNLRKEEIKELEVFFHGFSIIMPQVIHGYASQWKFKYPFEIQITMGCELHPGGAIGSFYRFAYQGSELLHTQNNSLFPSPNGGTRAQDVYRLFNQNHANKKIVQKILSDTCPRLLLSILDAGKADLQRQVRFLPSDYKATALNFSCTAGLLHCVRSLLHDLVSGHL
ncbi:T-cell surface glycoprotein CD1b [Myotis brandtii]|uniref:T-cell surface glycoprotein CD1b n=1 Tax=Myotis brandtii TaxID=109478 RepID=S7N687_MYOBR|nr:T-cell surface glycoprotein CD1b [Myotis brandtii]